LKLYRALVRAGAGGLACGTLQAKLGIAASTLSHHIRHLKEAGLISQERQATTLICRANYPAMNDLLGYLVDECCLDATCGAEGKAA
jgi:DNA-binding transcriptional ArsR family regulator